MRNNPLSLFPALFHWGRFHYYRIAVQAMHPLHDDLPLVSFRMEASRRVVARYLTHEVHYKEKQ